MEFKNTIKLSATIVLATFAFSSGAFAQVGVDPNLKDYERVPGISGSVSAVGSDTLNNMMTKWMEKFKEVYPNVTTQVEGKGSGTAPPALIEGTSQLGPMSRPMKASEVDKFVDSFGYKPFEVKVALDAVAVFVNKDNPIQGMTLTQLGAVFSSTRKRGGATIDTWDDLGLSGEFDGTAISIYGRNSASGTYAFFKKKAMLDGDYKDSVKENPGSSAVVQGIAMDLYGIGYSGVGYTTSGVKTVALSETSSGVYFKPNFQNAMTKNYPLARFLLIYVNKPEDRPMDATTKEFLKFVLSKQGQQVVVDDGYFPLPASFCEKMIAELEK